MSERSGATPEKADEASIVRPRSLILGGPGMPAASVVVPGRSTRSWPASSEHDARPYSCSGRPLEPPAAQGDFDDLPRFPSPPGRSLTAIPSSANVERELEGEQHPDPSNRPRRRSRRRSFRRRWSEGMACVLAARKVPREGSRPVCVVGIGLGRLGAELDESSGASGSSSSQRMPDILPAFRHRMIGRSGSGETALTRRSIGATTQPVGPRPPGRSTRTAGAGRSPRGASRALVDLGDDPLVLRRPPGGRPRPAPRAARAS